ncbi:MAG: hypothetical protein F4Y16_17710 [Holophagales bacterium]|nr:hypothetical protein [Holophagales bacterium]MYH24227.1 hypothetical protein [Holophagales bacterium]
MSAPDGFGRVLAALHQAALDDTQWLAAAALIEEVCGTSGNVLAVSEGTGDDLRIHFYQHYYRGEPREDLTRLYLDVYFLRDEAPPRIIERPAGQLIHAPDLYTERELKTSVAYNEGWRLAHNQNGLITRLEGRDGLHIVWALNDPVDSGGWQSDQLRLIESLLPHVRQFVEVRQALAGAHALSAGLAGLLDKSRIGVLHMDRDGRVLAANDPAGEVLRCGQGLSDRGNGALHATLPADDRRLQRLLKRALPAFGSETAPVGGSMRLQRASLRSRLELYVHPVGAPEPDFGGRRVAALVLVVDPERRPRIDAVRLATLLGLSPSESRVAASLAEGRPVREIAATAGYKESYVRWLLKQVYRKQGVSGQIALVQRVLTAYAFPRR